MPSHDFSISPPKSPPPVGLGNQAVAHRARWVDFEEVAGAPVEERIDREHEAIVGFERLVALHLVAEEPTDPSRNKSRRGSCDRGRTPPGPRSSRWPARRCLDRAAGSRWPAAPSATPSRPAHRRRQSTRRRRGDMPGSRAGRTGGRRLATPRQTPPELQRTRVIKPPIIRAWPR